MTVPTRRKTLPSISGGWSWDAFKAHGIFLLGAVLNSFRRHRRLVSLSAFGIATTAAYGSAFIVYFDWEWPAGEVAVLGPSLVVLLAARLIGGAAWGLSTHRWRFVGVGDVRRMVYAVATGAVVLLALHLGSGPDPVIPATVVVLEPVFTALLMAGLWLSYRTAYEIASHRGGGDLTVREVLIVGAGEAGEALVRQMLVRPTGYRPVALVDDDPARQGTSIHGVKVLGGIDALGEVVIRTAAKELVIAVPSAKPGELRRIVEVCQSTGLPYRVLPGIAEVLDGHVSLAQLRTVQIEDLLGRDPVELDIPQLAQGLKDRTVLVTGAAGSIGSELARHVALHRPGQLVLLDRSETGLFFLEMELKELTPGLDLVPMVADIVDSAAVQHVYDHHRPSWVLHAAAYKHVPMMESNAREALRNNVVGTWRVAEAAGRHGVERFILVSTDKAVRPANIMGATKRVAEMLVLELQTSFPKTVFGAVRFGNVLGSSGSVVPIFRQQLEAGKPLTVTHPEVTRYFMTIPEATQLVLQASLLPELRGRIAMLDMGQPVRILDLARALLRLSGGRQEGESIVFTGLRPGEKLHEELVAPNERSIGTRIPRVRILHPAVIESLNILARMPEWDRLLEEWRPGPVLAELERIVPEMGGWSLTSGPGKHRPYGKPAATPAGAPDPTKGETAPSRRTPSHSRRPKVRGA